MKVIILLCWNILITQGLLFFKEMKVPDILVSGNHEEIKLWRKQKMLERTLDRRNDLISNDDYKKLPKSKRINRDSNEIMKFRIGNEYDFYPNW